MLIDSDSVDSAGTDGRGVDVNESGSLMVVFQEKITEQVMMKNLTIMVRIMFVTLAALLKVTMMLMLMRVVIIMIIE